MAQALEYFKRISILMTSLKTRVFECSIAALSVEHPWMFTLPPPPKQRKLTM